MLWKIIGWIVVVLVFSGMVALIQIVPRIEARDRKRLADAIRERGRIKTVLFYDEEEERQIDH